MASILQNMPDELFEREIFLELDSSKAQQQKYIGVYTLNASDLNYLDDGYEQVRVPTKKYRSEDDVFEKGYLSQDEKNKITEDNLKLIDKCIGENAPKSDDEKRKYSIDDIREVCYEAFAVALNNYPKNESTAKVTSFAYTCMTNACKDFIKRANAKKRGSFISLEEQVGDSRDKGDENTIEDVYAGEEDYGYEDTEKKILFQNFVGSVFEGMDKYDVLLLKYIYGIGEAEYEHSEAELAELTHLPLKMVRREINRAQENFKLALYERGLLAEAEDILTTYVGLSERRIEREMQRAKEKYLDSLLNTTL